MVPRFAGHILNPVASSGRAGTGVFRRRADSAEMMGRELSLWYLMDDEVVELASLRYMHRIGKKKLDTL